MRILPALRRLASFAARSEVTLVVTVGYFASMSGRVACSSCADILDQYQDRAGQDRCLKCPENTRRDMGLEATKSKLGCICKGGFYAPEAAQGFVCKACPQGGECVGHLHLP